jgi:RNA polymerase sigma-70 factor, ECF subfamily
MPVLVREDKTKRSTPNEDGRVSPAPIPDEVLIARACTGDKEAVALLFRRYARLVRSIGRRILRDDAEADDLVQEVFLHVYKKSSCYDSSRSSARSWLVQTSYYLALHRRMCLAADHRYFSAEPAGAGTMDLLDRYVPPYDRSIEGVLGRGRWREVFATLTTDQWETLRLHFFEGYTLVEISERVRQPIGNVRHHYYRGLDKLRRQFVAANSTQTTTR